MQARTTALAAVLVAGSLSLSGCSKVDADTDWTVVGQDATETRYSQLEEINLDNVSRLGLE